LPLLFLGFWIILNGRIALEVVLLGIFVSAAMSLFTYRLIGFPFTEEKKVWASFGLHLIPYFLLLLKGIVIANFQMIRIILSPRMDIQPQIVYFKSPVKSDFSKILLMYSIQLTPGTVLCELEGDRFGIHAISPAMADGIDNTIFARKLKRIEQQDSEGGQ